eukprot:Selendium_serpulae@DN2065_c0_g1_i1.p1
MIWTTFPNHCNTTAFASPHVLSSIAVVFTFVDIFVCSEFVAGERTSSSPHVRDGQSEPAEMEAAKALLGLGAQSTESRQLQQGEPIEADQSVQGGVGQSLAPQSATPLVDDPGAALPFTRGPNEPSFLGARPRPTVRPGVLAIPKEDQPTTSTTD